MTKNELYPPPPQSPSPPGFHEYGSVCLSSSVFPFFSPHKWHLLNFSSFNCELRSSLWGWQFQRQWWKLACLLIYLVLIIVWEHVPVSWECRWSLLVWGGGGSEGRTGIRKKQEGLYWDSEGLLWNSFHSLIGPLAFTLTYSFQRSQRLVRCQISCDITWFAKVFH